MAKVEALPYDDKTVYSVAAFNRGVAQWLGRLPTVWVEGEITELRRHDRWASVFFTLKDPADGSCLGVTMPRGQFDGLRLELADGERVHVYGRPELFHIAQARSGARLLPRLSKHGKQDSSEDSDNCYHNKQLDQREAYTSGPGLAAVHRQAPFK